MSAERGGKRPRQEEAAISALLGEPTIAGAAAKAGVAESTLRRWLAEPSFKARYRQSRLQVVEQAIGSLQQAAGEAVVALRRNLACGTPAVEVGAAKAILDQALKGAELVDLAERIEQLEAAAQTQSNEGRR